jgi:pilus assembly protein CpaE
MSATRLIQHTDTIEPAEEAAPYCPSLVQAAPPRPAAPKRDKFIGFTKDAETAALLHDALAGYLPEHNQIHVVDFRASLAILAATRTPEIILIDLSGEDQPINALMELAESVEPGTAVLAIGENQNVSFYRTLTRGMGIKEYLAKPLTSASIERNFLPIIANLTRDPIGPRGGRIVTITGARGGVGASTLTTNLAWFISACQHRHTVLLDADLHTGTVALNLNLDANKGLAAALESPERLDPLLIERSTQYAGERLHVLAGQEALDHSVKYQADGAIMLMNSLRARYNFALADTGSKLSPFARDLCFAAHQRVIVLDPSMVSLRNLERLLALPAGPSQSPRTITVLNKAGMPGGLSQSYMEQAMGMKFDAVIPDLPRIVPKTTQMGEQAAALRGPYRNAIAALATALGATLMVEVA